DRVDQLGQVVVIGQDRAAVAEAAQWLGGEEAGGGDVSPVDRVLAVQGAAKALGGVGDQLQPVPVANLANAGIVRRLAEQVDRDDDLRRQAPFGLHRLDRRLKVGGIDVVGR